MPLHKILFVPMQAYERSSHQDQFVARFIIREAAFQLSKLSGTLEITQKKFQENGIPLIDGSDEEEPLQYAFMSLY